jgi:hypothetical protein
MFWRSTVQCILPSPTPVASPLVSAPNFWGPVVRIQSHRLAVHPHSDSREGPDRRASQPPNLDSSRTASGPVRTPNNLHRSKKPHPRISSRVDEKPLVPKSASGDAQARESTGPPRPRPSAGPRARLSGTLFRSQDSPHSGCSWTRRGTAAGCSKGCRRRGPPSSWTRSGCCNYCGLYWAVRETRPSWLVTLQVCFQTVRSLVCPCRMAADAGPPLQRQ